MKRVINVSLLILLIITGTMAKAAEKFSVEISNASMVNVSLSEVSKGEKLTLKDYSGVILYDVTLEATPLYQKYFNFGEVPNGIYFIETEEEHAIKITPIIKNDARVSLINKSAITIFKPQIQVKDAIVKLLFNNTTGNPVILRLYDANSVILDQIEGNKDDIFKKAYDFTNMPEGEYTLYLAQDGRSFVEKIQI